MIKTYLKIVIRNILHNPLPSGINIIGFAIGIASVIVIGLWIQYELNFDKFHTKAEDIFQVNMKSQINKSIVTPTLFGPGFQKAFPEVINSVRFYQVGKDVFQYNENIFNEDKGYFVDNSIFEIFDFRLKVGDKKTSLSEPYSVTISEKLAKKYFGDQNPLGMSININGTETKIDGVFYDLPDQSHLQFDYLLSLKTVESIDNNFLDWNSDRVITYLLLQKNTNTKLLEDKIGKLISSNTDIWDKLKITTHLQALKKVYFNAEPSTPTYLSGKEEYIYIFSIVGIAILLISCINFINLYKAQNSNRKIEIGLTKIYGATKLKLIFQFLFETFIHIFFAFLFAIILIIFSTPLIDKILNFTLNSQLSNLKVTIIILTATYLICLSSGVIPAIYLSSFDPVMLLKKVGKNSMVTSRSKNSLIIIQFIITNVLLISTIVAFKQKDFLIKKDLHFSKEQIIYIPFKGLLGEYDAFKEELLKKTNVTSVTHKTCNLDDFCDGGPFYKPGQRVEDGVLSERCWVGYDYFKTLSIQIKQGRSFSREFNDVGNACILNQIAVEKIGFDNPIGKEIFFNDQRRIIIGIIDNVLTKSLHDEIYPQVYILDEDRRGSNGVILIKTSGDPSAALSSIKETWDSFNPQIPFEYNFLDKHYAQLYEPERRATLLLSIFTIIVIIIASSGIFGVSLFIIYHRTKEIGIHIVNGAKAYEIIKLLNKDIVKCISIAIVIGTPIAWYSTHKWLDNFAYKTNLSWWIFVLAGLLVVAITLLTISWQSWRAAMRNPVETLRYE